MAAVVIIGRQGPAFGDRPSATVLDTAHTRATVRNFPRADRGEALRAAFECLDGHTSRPPASRTTGRCDMPADIRDTLAARVSSDAPPDALAPFDPAGSTFRERMAAGHLLRTGHELAGFYVRTDTPGIVRLVRTCCHTGEALR